MTRQVKFEDCAVVNKMQEQLMYNMFGLNPWSYMYEDPFDLAKQLEEQEKAIREMSGKI